MTTEQRELDLVEKVDFRILSVCNNEEKLQQLLTVYLPPLLLKAASEHGSVRNKVRCPFHPLPSGPFSLSPHEPKLTMPRQVVGICQRLNTFIQSPG